MKWICTKADARATRQLQDELDLLPSIASVLVKMGLSDPAQAEKFLSPQLSHVTDPFLIPNLERAAELIVRAVNQHERVTIVGDYDVDGVTAVSVLVRFFRHFGLDPHYFVPRRKEEGYGLSDSTIACALEPGTPSLFFALDCGTNAIEQIRDLRSRGIEVVVIDHHLCKGSERPDAVLVNPNSTFAAAPDYSAMCTVGLMFKVLHGVLKIMRSRRDERSFDIILREFLDFVALGTITDISPLIGENRVMVWFGLRQMRNSKCKGLRALISASNIADTAEIFPVDVSHRIGPRINASGRLADASLPVEMFLCEDEARCAQIAKELSDMNRARQEIERAVFEEALAQLESQVDSRKALLAYGDWHPGVVSIVAGKLARHFARPCVVLGIEDGIAKGSGRSVPAVNLIEVLRPYGHELDSWGGHPMAVGISVDAAKLEDFRDYLDRAVGEVLDVSGTQPREETTLEIAEWLTLGDITTQLFGQIMQLSPFGECNPEPIFGIRDVVMPQGAIVFGGNNYRFQMTLPNSLRLGFVAWHKPEGLPVAGTRVDMAVRLSWNNYNGRKYQQAELVAWRPTVACESDTSPRNSEGNAQ